MDSLNAKAELRARVRALRQGLSLAEREAAAEQVAERCAALPEFVGVSVALGYHALEQEIDPAPLLETLRSTGARVALPRVAAGGRLTFHWVGDATTLELGALGIMEPPADAAGPELGEIDLVLVPGVAFDERCCRLGFGGGYYDRLLAELPARAAAVGLAYDVQIVPEIPIGELDRPVHLIVTPSGVFRAGS